ncbi:unnamed protein product [Adineta steineri]|uniref:Uncharacterized protein n=1 Tax=Adineta steineri TaxID=433720 RepID=A0A818U5F2_9BILA|nr:unnamed protein product [Adineta steineri]CAF1118719.1 unnamed protein product [Adineta steineri]CAF3693711.1 unnamed protein product [Adineta steineri]CAF3723270.1 unnamed protein product [Adineta steineri]
MGHFQPVLPLLKTNVIRRRSRTWQILGLIVVLFLSLTFIAVRYLPAVVIDPVSVLKNRDFKDIFVPPIPRPPVNWPNLDHDHSLHLSNDQSKLKQQIYKNKEHLINLDGDNKDSIEKPIKKPNLNNITSFDHVLPVENLTNIFSHMSIDELQKIQSVQMRREKVREVS